VLKGFGLEQTALLERVREAVLVTRRLLKGEMVSHRSATLVVDDVRLDFDVSQPVPVFIGTRGPRMLKLGGEIADAVMFEGLFMPGAARWAMERIDEGERGRSAETAAPRRIAWQSLTLAADPGVAKREDLKRWAALLISSTESAVLQAIGLAGQTVETVRAEIAAVGVEKAGMALTEEDVRKLVLTGSPDQIAERVSALAAVGVDEVACIVLGGCDEVRSQMDTFARRVIARGVS
jgi:5,10-methylenetetrahydromethanopterin reductase